MMKVRKSWSVTRQTGQCPMHRTVILKLCPLWPVMPLVVMMFLSLLSVTIGSVEAQSCHLNTQEQFQVQPRYFSFDNKLLDIRIESSNRISHRIVNYILQILLQKVAGYQMVDIVKCDSYDIQNITVILDRVSGLMSAKHCAYPQVNTGIIPDTMVNLETWMTAGFSKAYWLDRGRLLDAGPLGPQGRMGWYVPTWLVDSLWAKNRIILDHWRSLLRSKVTRALCWFGRPELQALAIKDSNWVKSTTCVREKCATLFVGYKGDDLGVLESQVKLFKLQVDVVYLEEHFNAFIEAQLAKREKIMFFNWHPNDLIVMGNLSRISFPEMYVSQEDEKPASLTDFQVNQLNKVTWAPLKQGAPEAFHIINKMSFSDTEYDKLVTNVSTPWQQACQWVRQNTNVWKKWLPSSLLEKPKIYLGGLFPLSGKSWSQPGLVEGAKLAIDLVNADHHTLPNHTLQMIVEDTKCEYDIAMSQFISLVQRPEPPVVGILGPGCSDPAERIAALSKHFNMVIVSYGAEAQALSEREKYPYFFRTVPPVQLYNFVYPHLFHALGWRTVGALAGSGQELPEYHLSLEEELQLHGISLIMRRIYVNHTGSPGIREILRDFKAQNVRIIIADVFSNVAREVMCEAHKQHMTAYEGYIWFLPSWYPSGWTDVEYYNREPNLHEAYAYRENVQCTTAEVESAAEGHFVLSKSFTAPKDTKVAGNISVGRYEDLYAQRCGAAYVEESKFASFVYDAVWVFAKGLHQVLQQSNGAVKPIRSKNTASLLKTAISKLDFMGVSGHIKFNGSDRFADLLILQVFSNETLQIGNFTPFDVNTGRPLIYINKTLIRWLSPLAAVRDNGEAAEEDCTIESFRAQLNVTCTVAIIVVIGIAVCSLVIIVIIILVLFCFIKYKCDAKVQKFRAAHERIKELGLLKDEYSHILTVDEWEIPRKDVVLNRELGEGAFGTVMGGEMYKEGEGWVAVAVKTLKVQHTMEEKLDFFTEVDRMKCLHHENIVQLLGVCTRKVPMYAVMEFLLHGDLKTYLLSRRSLVGQGVKEAEDVKAEKLTQMAIDVANGLAYLHSLKFVHRDLACRNCMVHSNRTVKIGDFGMTRHTSSTDYYRFNRKGMLPVRWTAPEALKDGIYLAKSDIWSFGVLVFEIVTFGSFPYQGLSNKEVLDFVTSGNQLMLPDKCPAALKSFIYWCMSHDPGYRPDLDDILSYLNYSPAFLTPCLDAPTTSVMHEDTDSLESQLPTKQSSSSHLSMVQSVPTGFFQAGHQQVHTWQHKLKDKKKTFSVPGLSSLGKSSSTGKGFATRSPAMSRSSSLRSETAHSTSACGLHSCGIGGGWGLGGGPESVFTDKDTDERDAEVDDDVTSEVDFKTLDSPRSSQHDRREGGEPEIPCSEFRQSFGSDHNRYSSTIGSDKGEGSSGYLSQESKQICQTVTSL